jgi:predicted dehydrogenase
MIRVGFVGFGEQAAKQHAACIQRQFADTVGIVAVTDVLASQIATARRALAELGVGDVPVYATPDEPGAQADDAGGVAELLARHPDLDAVIVSTPSAKHYRQVLACLTAGVHVLVDKPLALTTADASRLVALARERDRLLAVCSQRRYEEVYRYAKRAIVSGDLGTPLSINAVISHEDWLRGWRRDAALAGGGVLWDFGWHLIDVVLYLVGRDLASVDATVHAPGGGAIETHVSALIRFEGGLPFTVTINAGAPRRSVYEALQVWGSDGILFLLRNKPRYDTRPPTVIHQRGDGSVFRPDLAGAVAQRWAPTAAFLEALSRGLDHEQARQSVLSTGADSLDTVRVIEAMYASARSGSRVETGVLSRVL